MPRRKPLRKCVMKLMRSGFTRKQARKECEKLKGEKEKK
jgi:hypothetical protein